MYYNTIHVHVQCSMLHHTCMQHGEQHVFANIIYENVENPLLGLLV